MRNVDVAIVGGGPAGLCAAIEFAQLGFLVTVIEPQNYIIDKACGEGIMPEGVEHLRRLKILPHLDAQNMSKYNGVCLINEKGVKVYSKFARASYGLGCRRLNLSQALFARVREYSNINILPGFALGLKKCSKTMLVETEKGTVSARLVVGADGLRSSCRRWAGLLGADAEKKRYGLRQHYRVKPWSNFVEVHFKPGIEAYITPCGPSQTNIAFLWTKGQPKLSAINFASMLELFPSIKKNIAGHEALSEPMAIGPLEQKCKSPIAPGLALIGDASGYLDAITGEGNSLAFAQSQALSMIVNKALRNTEGSLSEKDLEPYANAHRRIVKSYYRNTKIMLWLSSRPAFMNNLIAAGSTCPAIFSWALEKIRKGGKQP